MELQEILRKNYSAKLPYLIDDYEEQVFAHTPYLQKAINDLKEERVDEIVDSLNEMKIDVNVSFVSKQEQKLNDTRSRLQHKLAKMRQIKLSKHIII